MATELPPDVDPRLWFTTDSCPSRHYLMDGNSTILGRMYFYCPLDNVATRVSKSQIRDSSDESKYFIRGFLAGSEPGPPVDDEGIMVPDESAVAAWRKATMIWRATGTWSP